MILCYQIQRLRPALADLSELVGRYQRGDVAFPDDTLKWLEESEKLLGALRMSGSSEISTLKGRITKASDALNLQTEKAPRSRIRSARNVAAAEALERAEEIMRSAITNAEERLQRFEEKLCEGMTALCLQVELPNAYSPRQEWLGDIWSLLANHGPTKPLATYIAASLSTADRLYLLDAVMDRVYERFPSRKQESVYSGDQLG